MLKPQDIVILVKLAIQPASYRWSYNRLAYELCMSPSEVHKGVKRATHSRLFDPNKKRPMRKALEEFLFHGVKYAFPPVIGPVTRGIPTAHATPVLEKHFAGPDAEMYVWPHPEGRCRGMELSPMYKTVPDMVANDERLYHALGVLDAVRIGRAREARLAEELLLKLMRNDESR